MSQRIPSKWSYIVKYMGGHPNITEECDAILRFTRKRIEIESLYKGKIALDYKDCRIEIQSGFERRRIVLIYDQSSDTEGRIFMQIKKKSEENVVGIFQIYQKLSLGSDDDIPKESNKLFKLFK
ncbi:hypothetical protein [Anaerosacchariphilus polymeriproducens]|uniref:Uncharacterized protein n=1 Tax=Anaerosacchariphilus polymeriproducens TaxID=1812858 RepID=A0A371AZP5_9FIRM|nr:hypothetical protein [Anaerosacchariphilus polymeriproducens]RDU24972.1 hypothetical protein DWV06_01720 [Anaerosacchariphilus polymeriproducens]